MSECDRLRERNQKLQSMIDQINQLIVDSDLRVAQILGVHAPGNGKIDARDLLKVLNG